MSDLFSSEGNKSVAPPKRKLIWFIPLFTLAILAGLFLATGWRTLLPAKAVDVARARIGEATSLVKSGEVEFRAAGWVEADPFPIKVTALVSGVVKKIHVIDGQTVSKSQLLVELINEDLLLDLANAQAKLAELQLAQRKTLLEIKAEEVRLVELDALKESAQSAADRVQHKAKLYRLSGDAIPIFDKEQAELEHKEKLKIVDEFESRKQLVNARIALIKNGVDLADAKIKTHKIKIDIIELNLRRTKIYAPTDGVIEHLYAREGRKQMLGSDNEDSTTVARMFDTKNIQVAVDVPLSDVGKVKVGQATKIHVEFLKMPLKGVVSSIFGHADYQKNTLEVKVKIIGGHDELRPDMLAQVEFLGVEKEVSQKAEKVSGVYIKKDALLNDSKVWVVSTGEALVLRSVEAGSKEIEGWIEIVSGINPGERVVLSPMGDLKDGDTVKVRKVYE